MAYYREAQIQLTSGDLTLISAALKAFEGTEVEVAAANTLAQQIQSVRNRDREIVLLIRGSDRV